MPVGNGTVKSYPLQKSCQSSMVAEKNEYPKVTFNTLFYILLSYTLIKTVA